MKKKLLVIMMATMMLSVTACTQNTPKGNDSASEESSDTTSTDNNENSGNDVDSQGTSNGSNTEVDYDTTGMDSYTDKDGNVYYFDYSEVPDWWEGKVEIVKDNGTVILACVIEVPDTVYLFNEKIADRVSCSEEEFKNGEFHCNSYWLMKYVPEGWEIDYSKSTSEYKYMYNKDMDVYVDIHLNGKYDINMYSFDNYYSTDADGEKFYWNLESGGKEAVFDAPDYIDYSVQTYEEYMGYEPGTLYYEFGPNQGIPYLFVRTYSDGRVYYDCFWDGEVGPAMISITKEDAQKMQSAGVYSEIYEALGKPALPEEECEYAKFACIYLLNNKYLDPEDKRYWKN